MPENSLQTKPTIKLPKIDKRTKNGKKIDLAEVIKLRDVQGLSFPKIGSILNLTPQYIQRAYDKFKTMIQDTDMSNVFQENRTNILSSLELNLLQDLGSTDKREKASLNNVAYAFNQIHTARRLEEGKGTAGGLSITIEVAYQEATDRSRNIRMKHAGSSSPTPMDSTSDDNDRALE